MRPAHQTGQLLVAMFGGWLGGVFVAETVRAYTDGSTRTAVVLGSFTVALAAVLAVWVLVLSRK